MRAGICLPLLHLGPAHGIFYWLLAVIQNHGRIWEASGRRARWLGCFCSGNLFKVSLMFCLVGLATRPANNPRSAPFLDRLQCILWNFSTLGWRRVRQNIGGSDFNMPTCCQRDCATAAGTFRWHQLWSLSRFVRLLSPPGWHSTIFHLHLSREPFFPASPWFADAGDSRSGGFYGLAGYL